MNFVFLMDPLETVNPKKDTTYLLMLGAQSHGHTIYYLPKGGISLIDGKVVLSADEIIPQRDDKNPFQITRSMKLTEDKIDVVFIRTDPPFDQDYLLHTWMLDHLPDTIPVINRPQGVRTLNEKIWAARYTDIVPKTYIGRKENLMKEFMNSHDRIIAKPTDGYGGQGVFLLTPDEGNTQVILETLSDNFTKDIILQEYLPGSDQGDKRILLWDGKPLGAVLRVHKEGDHRNNFFSGGKPVAAGITDRDRTIIDRIAPDLKKLGLTFVGIDIIDEMLVEINVTSPTCLQEMNRLYSQNLEEQVISSVESLIKKHRKQS